MEVGQVVGHRSDRGGPVGAGWRSPRPRRTPWRHFRKGGHCSLRMIKGHTYSTLTGTAGADVTSPAGVLSHGGGVRMALVSGLEFVLGLLLLGSWLWKLLESFLHACCSVGSRGARGNAQRVGHL